MVCAKPCEYYGAVVLSVRSVVLPNMNMIYAIIDKYPHQTVVYF